MKINAPNRLKEIAVEIKPENRGKLHKRLGIPEGETIPMSRLHSELKKAKDSGDTELEKMVNFAINFHHKASVQKAAKKRLRDYLVSFIPEHWPGTTAVLEDDCVIVKGPKAQLDKIYKEYHEDGHPGELACYRYPNYVSITSTGRKMGGMPW